MQNPAAWLDIVPIARRNTAKHVELSMPLITVCGDLYDVGRSGLRAEPAGAPSNLMANTYRAGLSEIARPGPAAT